jgi:hypothetical protein
MVISVWRRTSDPRAGAADPSTVERARRSRPLVGAAVVALIGALVLPIAATATQPEWSEPDSVARDVTMLETHSAVAVGDTIHAVYIRQDVDTDAPFDGRLVYRRSDDGGRTWAPGVVLFQTTARFVDLIPDIAIAADGRTVVVAFRSREGASALLFARGSSDGGRTWAPRVELDRIRTDLRMGIPSAAVSADTVLVTWSSRVDGAIRLRRSLDGGATFSPPMTLGATRYAFGCMSTYRDGLVSMAAARDAVFVLWTDNDPGVPTNDCGPDRLVLRRSTDGGATFLPRQVVDDQDNGGWPELATDGRTVLASYADQAGHQVLSRSTDAGASWTRRTWSMSGGPSGAIAGTADVALRPNGDAVLAWTRSLTDENGAPTWSEIRVRRSGDGGATWSAAEVVVPQGHALVTYAMNVVLAGPRPVVLLTTGASYEGPFDLEVVRGSSPHVR